jgi:pimeloyl-ACP methyl ester carboxylesterase
MSTTLEGNSDWPPEYRAGSGPPLLLLHGILASWHVWTPVLAALAQRHEVFAPTLAGHAGGPPLPRGVTASVPALADALERRLDELGFGTVHIAGNSLGGWLALELAKRGRAISAVALSPACGWQTVKDLVRVSAIMSGGHFTSLHGGMRLRRMLARPGGRRLVLNIGFEHPEAVSAWDAVKIIDDNAGCAVLGEFLRSVWSDGPMVDPSVPDGCPVRIGWPERDRTLPFEHYGAEFCASFPQAELVRLPAVGHIAMFDDPELIARTILEVTAAEEPEPLLDVTAA